MKTQIRVDTNELRTILSYIDATLENETIYRMKEAVVDACLPDFDKNRKELIEQARSMYQDEDIEVDEDAALSDAETHIWVSAWVCVHLPDVETEGP